MRKTKPGPKASLQSRTVPITFRVNKSELNRLKGMTAIYTKEGMSDYIRMCVFGYKKYALKGAAAK